MLEANGQTCILSSWCINGGWGVFGREDMKEAHSEDSQKEAGSSLHPIGNCKNNYIADDCANMSSPLHHF